MTRTRQIGPGALALVITLAGAACGAGTGAAGGAPTAEGSSASSQVASAPTAASTPQSSAPPFPYDNDTAPGVLHHTGGPYQSQSQVQDALLATLGCTLGGPQSGFPGTACSSVTVRFYSKFDQAYIANPSWSLISAWASDREVYFVSVRGHIQFSAHDPVGTPIVSDHYNAEIDATTGQILGAGTQGVPVS